MSATCPCCGQPIHESAKGDLTVGGVAHVSRGGHVVNLTVAQMKILRLLWRRYPGIATRENIMDALYGDEPGPEGQYATMKVQISKLRTRLRLLGVGIESVRDQGYQLTLTERADARAA